MYTWLEPLRSISYSLHKNQKKGGAACNPRGGGKGKETIIFQSNAENARDNPIPVPSSSTTVRTCSSE